MKIDREKNTAFKVLNELVCDEQLAEKLLKLASYRKSHNISKITPIKIEQNIDEILTAEINTTIRKPREMSQATKDKNYEKALARLKLKYGK